MPPATRGAGPSARELAHLRVAQRLLWLGRMRHWTSLGLALPAACVAEDSPDRIDEVGLGGGKADGVELSECEAREIVAYLNEGVTADELKDAGVHARAASALVAHRDGPDGQFGTE